MKCPPNYGRIYDPKGPCQLKNWHLPSASATMRSLGTVATWPSTHPLKEFSVEIKDEVLCALENWQNKPSDGYILKRFYSPNSYIISYLDNTKNFYQRHLLWPIKEKNETESQNGVAVVETLKVINIRRHYGRDFRQGQVLLRTWVFWAVSDMGCHLHFKTMSTGDW